MPVRRAKSLTFRARGLTDATDATNAFGGSMQSLQNLIPNPTTNQQFVPRPASIRAIDFSGGDTGLQDSDGNFITSEGAPFPGDVILGSSGPFVGPTFLEALYVVGSRAYGMIATGRYPGHSEPYCYDMTAGNFVPIANVTAANTPVSEPTTGDWTPPTMIMIANKIIITHPGYDGVTHFIGWIDVSGFSSTTITGDTHSNHSLTFAASVLLDGWQVGQLISDSAGDIPGGTYITNISADGKTVTISNAATGSNTGTTFTVSGGSFAAPTYGAGQTAPIALAAVPKAVTQFNGRAYYAVLNGVTFSDSLNPLVVSGAGGTFVPVLLFGDDTPVTALVGVPLANQVIGGVIQSVIAFKGADHYWQITGDPEPSPGNLATNEVNGSVGTLAPNSIAPTPLGIAYAAPDGIRIIGLNAQSSQPLGADGQGVSVPFLYAINPSRMAAAYNQNVYRISVQNGFANSQPNQEYWYDFNLQVWTGPHTFPASLIAPTYQPNGFLLAAVGIGTSLWSSTALPSSSSSYLENGVAMNFVWQPSLLPDNGSICANSSPQGALGMALPASAAVVVLAINELGDQLGQVQIGGTGSAGTVWDAFNWGGADWGADVVPYRQYTLPWIEPLVFKQATLRVAGQSVAGFAIGNAYLQYQELGYIGSAGVVGAAA